MVTVHSMKREKYPEFKPDFILKVNFWHIPYCTKELLNIQPTPLLKN